MHGGQKSRLVRFLVLLLMLVEGLLAAPAPISSPTPPPPTRLRIVVWHAAADWPMGDWPVQVGHRTVRTDSAGESLLTVQPGRYHVRVLEGDATQKSVTVAPRSTTTVFLRVRPRVMLEVKAQEVGSGEGLPGSLVYVDGHMVGKTDGDGVLRVRVKPGQRKIQVRRATHRFSPSSLSTALSSLVPDHGVLFEGQPVTGRLRIQVVTDAPDGQVGPLAGARVVVRRGNGRKVLATLVTGMDGVVVTDEVVLGRYTVDVQAEGFEAPSRSTLLSAPGEAWVTLRARPTHR